MLVILQKLVALGRVQNPSDTVPQAAGLHDLILLKGRWCEAKYHFTAVVLKVGFHGQRHP